MNIFESKHPAFRYLHSQRPNQPPPPDLSATRVVAVQLDPAPANHLCEKLKASVLQRHPELLTVSEALELHEFQERNSRHIHALMAPGLEAAIGKVPVQRFFPGLGVFQDVVAVHHDMPFYRSVFVAWHLAGPARELYFPEMDITLPFTSGSLVIFDPAQPHLVRRPADSPPPSTPEAGLCWMMSVSISRTPRLRAALGIERFGVRKHRGVPTTRENYQPCPDTGRIEFA